MAWISQGNSAVPDALGGCETLPPLGLAAAGTPPVPGATAPVPPVLPVPPVAPVPPLPLAVGAGGVAGAQPHSPTLEPSGLQVAIPCVPFGQLQATVAFGVQAEREVSSEPRSSVQPRAVDNANHPRNFRIGFHAIRVRSNSLRRLSGSHS